MLTKQQSRLLMLIDEALRSGGVCPSFDEMRDRMGLKSKSGVHRLVKSLESRGFVRRLPNRARAVEIIRYPGHCLGSMVSASNDNAKVFRVPLYGKIAAGTPIEAIAGTGESMEVSSAALGRGRFYALKVEGDSMVNAGINSGDRVIIREVADAPNGAIVVALIDEAEATLKYLYKDSGMVSLKPANSNYEVRTYEPSRVRIQGRLVMLVRNY